MLFCLYLSKIFVNWDLPCNCNRVKGADAIMFCTILREADRVRTISFSCGSMCLCVCLCWCICVCAFCWCVSVLMHVWVFFIVCVCVCELLSLIVCVRKDCAWPTFLQFLSDVVRFKGQLDLFSLLTSNLILNLPLLMNAFYCTIQASVQKT